jgi:sRNA-binding protein
MREALQIVERCVPGLPVRVLAAFGDAVYNIGPTVACDVTKSTAARMLKAGQLEQACRQLPRWNKARVFGVLTELLGLTKRRKLEMAVCLGRRAVKAAAIALCAVLLAAVAYLVGDHRGATRQDLVCQVAHDAEEAQRSHRRARQLELDARQETQRETQRMLDRAAADAVSAERSRLSLQQRAQRLAAACAPAAAQPASGAASSAGLVLADVLGRADQAAGELAAALDRAHAAGLACEREHRASLIAHTPPTTGDAQ